MLIKNTVSVLLASALLAACSPAESVLTGYAEQRWDALIKGNLEQAYGYYTEAFQATTPFDVFQRNTPSTGLWSKAQVQKVECEASGKRCSVDVKVTVSLKMRGLSQPVDTSDIVKETWIKDSWFSDWRYVKK
ncbi:hypothetical protein [Thiothrix subterranea]|uniref:Lipoprotein n=1 Tax=Thiothrix subterranea TaxID=2735563 RepID=A0AA51MMJ6_9GAMM|nr:hypothetical protein [Thiothrix subterranea]MDQ5769549.1 hypothetical protein [Thiothrix subterranea]QQZ29487.1 hypothetical protein HMY34_12270 [Thiothrix subterranea]WML87132.1 hypothetical protein RCG00_01960 [Thiothrix subterranea]